MTDYLKTKIAESKQTETPRYGPSKVRSMAADGTNRVACTPYNLKSGAPTCYLIRLEGEKRWRRVMHWQDAYYEPRMGLYTFSGVGTLFVRIKGTPYIVREYDIPTPAPDTVAIESDTWGGVLAQADKLRT